VPKRTRAGGKERQRERPMALSSSWIQPSLKLTDSYWSQCVPFSAREQQKVVLFKLSFLSLRTKRTSKKVNTVIISTLLMCNQGLRHWGKRLKATGFEWTGSIYTELCPVPQAVRLESLVSTVLSPASRSWEFWNCTCSELLVPCGVLGRPGWEGKKVHWNETYNYYLNQFIYHKEENQSFLWHFPSAIFNSILSKHSWDLFFKKKKSALLTKKIL
jgi:hypothetical protein